MTDHHDSGNTTLTGAARAALRNALSGHLLIVWLLVSGVFFGLLLVKDYGVSWDEAEEVTNGSEALRAYSGSQRYFSLEATSTHGPAYYMLFVATSRAINALMPSWSLVDGRHLTNYFSFLVGLAFFYILCLRFMRPSSATLATVLFATQPLFFGSSFINQKDVPLMATVLVAVTFGQMAGKSSWNAHGRSDADIQSAGPGLAGLVAGLQLEWQGLGADRRKRAKIWSAIGLALSADLFVAGSIRRLGEALLTAAYNRRAPVPLQRVFELVATDAFKTPLGVYLVKFEHLFSVIRLTALVFMVGIGVGWLGRRLPSVARILGSKAPKVRNIPLVASSVALGAAISMRQVGFFAGILVTFYLLLRSRGRAILPLCLYWTIAGLVTYVTWPYLWPDPIRRLTDSFLAIREFGLHQVLFRGQVVPASALPWEFFPTLAALQLTEPALVLAAAGVGVLLRRLIRTKTGLLDAAILSIWVGGPIYWLISRDVPIYNNTRHLFFALPPLLVLAGIGIQAVFEPLRARWARVALAALVLFPGMLAIVLLHPYEYTYFNSLAGGTSGAYGVYDQEYYCVSLKEATGVVNQVAGQADHFMVFGQIQNAVPYARTDLILESQYSPLDKADIVAACQFGLSSRWDPADFSLVDQVRRGKAVFAEVWVRVRTSGSQ